MKNYYQLSLFSVLAFLLVSLSSCEAIAGIFKAGMWTGIIVVIAIVALVLWLINKARK